MEKSLQKEPYKTMRGHITSALGMVQLADGRRITCSHDGSLRLWDQGGEQIGDDWRDDEDDEEVWTIVLSPDGKVVATGSRDGTVGRRDEESRRQMDWTH